MAKVEDLISNGNKNVYKKRKNFKTAKNPALSESSIETSLAEWH